MSLSDPERPSDAEERLMCAHHGEARIGDDPKTAQIVGHVLHWHVHWYIAPSSALWFTGRDAVSVLKKGVGLRSKFIKRFWTSIIVYSY